MSQLPEVLDRKIVAKTRIFKVEQVDLHFANGEKRVYERLIGGATNGAITMVPMLDEHTILLVREYGAGVHNYYLSLPAGAVDDGETHLEAANRELKEEVGYGAKSWTHLFDFSSAPAYTTRVMPCWLAQDLYPAQLQGDEPEPIEVVEWSIHDLPGLIARPDFHDAKSVAALYMVRDLLHG